MNVTPALSVVIPIFNEQGCLRELYSRLVGVLQQGGASYEIIFVDDGSRDSSPELLKEFAGADFNVKVLRLSRNFGHQAAITAGLEHARGGAVVLMDGDLQDPPEVIPQFVEKWREGWDVVYAIKTRRKENAVKRFAFWLFYRLLGYMSDVTLPLDAGIFSLMDRRVVDWLKALPERNRYLAGLRVWVGFRQTGIEFERASRYDDRPRQTLGRLMKLALDGIFSFSQFPIHIISWLGALLSRRRYARRIRL
jgi:glycosyltransferase involved in cell wall biosynthesis